MYVQVFTMNVRMANSSCVLLIDLLEGFGRAKLPWAGRTRSFRLINTETEALRGPPPPPRGVVWWGGRGLILGGG
jgi:hypothetical protein